MMSHKERGVHPIMRVVRLAKVTQSRRRKRVMLLLGRAYKVS